MIVRYYIAFPSIDAVWPLLFGTWSDAVRHGTCCRTPTAWTVKTTFIHPKEGAL